MASKVYPSKGAPIPVPDLENWNTDREVDVPVMVRGNMYKTSADAWYYWDGQSRQEDAAFMRVSSIGGVSANQSLSALGLEGTAHIGQVSAVLVDDASTTKFLGRVSALGVTVTMSPLSADSSAISAKQEAAGNLRVSAFSDSGTTFNVSAALKDDGTITKFLGRVSALGVTVTTTPLSADRDNVSCHQDDAGQFRTSSFVYDGEYSAGPNVVVSARGVTVTSSMKGIVAACVASDAAFMRISGIGTFTVSAHEVKQSDAASLRISALLVDNPDITDFLGRVSVVGVSAIGEGTAFIGQVSVTGGLISATMKEGTAHIGQVSTILVDNPINATYLGRVSTVGSVAVSANQQLSAYCIEATGHIGSVSAVLVDDASITKFLGRVSVLGTSLVSAHEVKQSDAAAMRVSTYLIDNPTITGFIGRISSMQTDAANQRTSAIQDGAAALNVSAKSIAAATMLVSASQGSAEQLRVSSFQTDAANQQTSAKSDSAALFRTSSYLPVDTVGQTTVFRSLSLSASQAIKATAGVVYGYYLFNTTTVPQYIKLTNTSGAISVGTDTPITTFMLPASAAANVWFGQGLKGFTAGIGIHASSAVADNATTPAAASAVGGNIFFN